jgi:hypothetical protein
MADESRTLAVGNPPETDFNPLFDMLKSQREHGEKKELLGLQGELRMKELEKANEFSTILESMRDRNIRMRAEEAHQRQVNEELLKGEAIAGYTGDVAVQEANRGNVLESLVERRPELDTPEAALPGFVPKKINPRAATAAHTDLIKGIERKDLEERRIREISQARLLDQVGPNEVSQARAMVPNLRSYGNELIASAFETLEPGGMSKTQFNTMILQADKQQKDLEARMERLNTIVDMRLKVAEVGAKAKELVQQLKNKQKLEKGDLSTLKESRLQLSQEARMLQFQISSLDRQIDMAASPYEKGRLRREREAHQVTYDNLMITQQDLTGQILRDRADIASASEVNVVVSKIYKEMEAKGWNVKNKVWREFKGEQSEFFLKRMREHGLAPAGE